MKFKLGIITLLIAGLTLGLAGSAFAAVTVTDKDGTTDATPGATNVVLQAFTLSSNADGDTVDKIKVELQSADVEAEITKLSLYLDVDKNGVLGFNDTRIPGATKSSTSFPNLNGGLGAILQPTTALSAPNTVTAADMTWVLVVATFNTTGLTDQDDIDTQVSAWDVVTPGYVGPVTTTTNMVVEISATHLKWVNGGAYVSGVPTHAYALQTANTGNIVRTGYDLEMIKAIDDYGNTDIDFEDTILIAATDLFSGATLAAGLTATIDAVSFETGGTAVALTDGVFSSFHRTINYTKVGTEYAVLLTATSQGTSTFPVLVGTTAITWGARPNVTGVSSARGIEMYDIDHNGKLDHATLIFNAPVKDVGGTTPVTAFSVGGGTYTVSSVIESTDGIVDAGGYGIKNSGEYGVTLVLAENQGYNTGAKPQVTYSSAVGYLKDFAANAVANITTQQAVEVDKARPILLSYKTVDDGAAGGVANNGEVDGIQLTLSEPLATFTVNTALVATTAGAMGKTFSLANQYQAAGGSATATGAPVGISLSLAGTYASGTNVYTLAVDEKGSTNTGILPVLLHDEYGTNVAKDAAGNYLITDASTNLADTAKDIAIKDGVSPVVNSVTTADTGATPDGRIDEVTVIFSEDMNAVDSYTTAGVTFVSSVAAFGSVGGGSGTYAVTLGAVTSDTIVYTLTPSTAVYDTEAKPAFYYDPTATNAKLKDSNGFDLAAYADGTAGSRVVAADDIHDGAAPVVVTVNTGDDVSGPAAGGAYGFLSATGTPGADGRLDNVTVTFSEKVQATSKTSGLTDLESLVSHFEITNIVPAILTVGGGGVIQDDSTTNGTKPSVSHVSTGDTSTSLKFFFTEVASADASVTATNGGDTSYLTKLDYNKGAATADLVADMNDVQMADRDYVATKTVDKAKPFVMTIETGDIDGKAKPSDPTYEDNGNGDGFIDNFVFYFSETVKMADASDLTGFSADTSAGAPNAILFTEPGTGADFSLAGAYPADATAPTIDATDNSALQSKVILYAVSARDVSPDTAGTPTIDYAQNAANPIKDAAKVANNMASFSNKTTIDKAKPVIVQAIGVVGQNYIQVTFSESVQDKTGATALVNAGNTSNLFFGLYNNTTVTADGGGDGATAIGTGLIAALSGTSKFKVYTNAALTIDDVTGDMLYLNSTEDIEDAAANEAESDSDGLISAIVPIVSIRIPINDIIPPHLTDAYTVDEDNDGWIDHIVLTFNEAVNDVSIAGVVDANDDDYPDVPIVATSLWGIGGYTGVAFNFFDDSAAANSTTVDNALTAVVDGVWEDFYVHAGNAINDDTIVLMVAEQSAGANSFSSIGDTDAAPVFAFDAAITLADFRTNVFEPAPSGNAICEQDYDVTSARDLADPVLMSGALASETELQLKLSEKIVPTALGTNGSAQFANLFNLYVGSNQNDLWSSYVKDFTQEADGYLKVIWTNVWNITAENTAKARFNSAGYAQIKDYATTEQAWDSATRAANSPGAQVWVTIDPYVPSGDGGSSPDAISKAALAEAPADEAIINIGNVAAVGFSGKAAAADIVTVKLVDYNGNEVMATVTANSVGNFMGSLDAATLADGVVTMMAGIGATPTTWYTFADYTKAAAAVGAPATLAIVDVPGDNGGWVYATFAVSANHPDRNPSNYNDVQSYVFYREVLLPGAADANDTTWMPWADIAGAVTPKADGTVTIMLPTKNNTASCWKVQASTGKASSDMTLGKDADVPVASLIDGAEKAASVVVSAFSNVSTGAAVDNIAPAPLTSFAAASEASGGGVVASWVPPTDVDMIYQHGVVGTQNYMGAEVTIYGVNQYEVYSKKSSETAYTLAGVAGTGSTTLTLNVVPGSTVYNYYVTAVDGNVEHNVVSYVRSAMAQTSLKGDFDCSGLIAAPDFSIFAANYGKTNAADPVNYVWAYDMNADGSVGPSDFSIFAAAYGSTLKAAKAAIAEMPETQIPLAVTASVDEATSTYFVNVNIENSTDLKGFEFFLTYDPTAVDFVENSVSGLVGIHMTQVDKGTIRVDDWFVGEEFSGAVTLGFKSLGFNSTIDFGIGAAVVDEAGRLAAVTDITEATVKALPTVYSLSQNYPNPFNPTTTIDYSIPRSGNVELVIFNMAGQKVRTLVSGRQDAAFYKVVWNGRNEAGESVASGLYFYSLKTAGFSKIEKMTLVK